MKPHEFVQYGLACLEKFADKGDEGAKEIRVKLRVVVGMLRWLLKFFELF